MKTNEKRLEQLAQGYAENNFDMLCTRSSCGGLTGLLEENLKIAYKAGYLQAMRDVEAAWPSDVETINALEDSINEPPRDNSEEHKSKNDNTKGTFVFKGRSGKSR